MNTQVWFIGFVTAMVLFQVVSVPALILRKNDLADVLWGPAFPISAIAAAVWGAGGLENLGVRSVVMIGLISVWATRLFLHVGVRNLTAGHEDVRYNNWRKAWGKTWIWRSYLQVFVLQPMILFVFLTPVLLVISLPPTGMSFMAWVGVVVWISGVTVEAVADEQLRRFKSKPTSRGQLMTTGLWSWSRHPNYFGEVLSWWGIWLMVVDLNFGWATVISPIGVTYLILKVSGVSMLEDLMKNRPGFEEYRKRTSEFIPMPPKKF